MILALWLMTGYLPESLIESTIVLSIDETLTPRISSTKSVETTLIKEKLFPSNWKLLNLETDDIFTTLYTWL